MEEDVMTIGKAKEEKENVRVSLLTAIGSGGEVFWEGNLLDIPEEYEPLEIIREKWLLGNGIYRMYCAYGKVAEIQNGVEHFQKMIRQTLLLEGMQPELMKQIQVG